MANIRYIKSRGRWWVRYRAKVRGKKEVFKGSRTFLEKSQAVKYYAEMEEQERLFRSGQISLGEKIEDVTQDFNRHIKQFTPRTQQHYRHTIKRFIESLPKNAARIHDIKLPHIREYLYRLRDEGNKNRTLNAHLTAIKSYCRFFSEKLNIDNPAVKIKMLAEDPPKHRFLTFAEYQRILSVAQGQVKNRIIFLANTGLRASEFSNLTADCINPQTTAITITGKGRKRRTIPLNKSAREVLPHIKITGRHTLYVQFSQIAKDADIPKFGPHALRHYFATQLLLKGVPIIKVSKLLGHSSVRTTQNIYAHILADDMAHTTDVLD